jgi:CubicO group peptidase (beta-lactamase class C family)
VFVLKNLATGERVTPDTVFGIASVSKSVTAMAVLQLQDQGRLCVDNPVTRYLPEFKIRGIQDMSVVRLHHLLSHSTGLPPFKRHQEYNLLSQHIEYIATADYELLGSPGQYFSYCNDSFLMLGAVIERTMGRPFTEHMREAVFDPIGMTRTTYWTEEMARLGDVTELYQYDKKTSAHARQEWPDLGNHRVSGGIRCSVRDLLRYASVYTTGGVTEGRRIISEHAIWRMRQPVVRAGRNSYYGYALNVYPGYEGATLVSHGGSLPGVASHFGYVPEKGIAAVVLTNLSGAPSKALWLMAVNAALGLPVSQKLPPEPAWKAPSGHIEKYSGVYASPEGGKVRIFVDGSKALAEVAGEVYELRPSDERTLVYEAQDQEAVLEFFTRDDGKAWAVRAGSRMLRKLE